MSNASDTRKACHCVMSHFFLNNNDIKKTVPIPINDQSLNTLVTLVADGWIFVCNNEHEYLSGNEYVMLQMLRKFLTLCAPTDFDKLVISNVAHELLLKFQQLNSRE